MGKKESLQKKIDQIENNLKHLRALLLALYSGLVWVIYAIMEHKAGKEILILGGVGIIITFSIFLRTKFLENEVDNLIEQLEKEQ